MRFFCRLGYRRTDPVGLNCVARVQFEYPPPIREPTFVIAHTLAIFVSGIDDIMLLYFCKHGPYLTRLLHNHPHHVRGAPRAIARLCGRGAWRPDAAHSGQADPESLEASRPSRFRFGADRHIAFRFYFWLGKAGTVESV